MTRYLYCRFYYDREYRAWVTRPDVQGHYYLVAKSMGQWVAQWKRMSWEVILRGSSRAEAQQACRDHALAHRPKTLDQYPWEALRVGEAVVNLANNRVGRIIVLGETEHSILMDWNTTTPLSPDAFLPPLSVRHSLATSITKSGIYA